MGKLSEEEDAELSEATIESMESFDLENAGIDPFSRKVGLLAAITKAIRQLEIMFKVWDTLVEDSAKNHRLSFKSAKDTEKAVIDFFLLNRSKSTALKEVEIRNRQVYHEEKCLIIPISR